MNEKSVNKAIGWGLILGGAGAMLMFAWAGLSELQGVAEVVLTGANVRSCMKSAASHFGLAALVGWLAVPGWLMLTDTSV